MIIIEEIDDLTSQFFGMERATGAKNARQRSIMSAREQSVRKNRRKHLLLILHEYIVAPELTVRWQPETRGIVHLPINESAGQTDGPDIFLIYVNGDPQWIKRNMSDKVRRNWIDRNVLPEFKKDFYGFPLEMTRNWTGYNTIPKSIYIHGYETITSELKRRGLKMTQAQNQQQPQRHINDVVNEKLASLDAAFSDTKSFISTLKTVINEQADVIRELNGVIRELNERAGRI